MLVGALTGPGIILFGVAALVVLFVSVMYTYDTSFLRTLSIHILSTIFAFLIMIPFGLIGFIAAGSKAIESIAPVIEESSISDSINFETETVLNDDQQSEPKRALTLEEQPYTEEEATGVAELLEFGYSQEEADEYVLDARKVEALNVPHQSFSENSYHFAGDDSTVIPGDLTSKNNIYINSGYNRILLKSNVSIISQKTIIDPAAEVNPDEILFVPNATITLPLNSVTARLSSGHIISFEVIGEVGSLGFAGIIEDVIPGENGIEFKMLTISPESIAQEASIKNGLFQSRQQGNPGPYANSSERELLEVLVRSSDDINNTSAVEQLGIFEEITEKLKSVQGPTTVSSHKWSDQEGLTEWIIASEMTHGGTDKIINRGYCIDSTGYEGWVSMDPSDKPYIAASCSDF